MKQLTQQLKSGKMEILEVPFPVLEKGQILVRNHFSIISAGTEGKTVSDARKGYIAKARSRQKEVKQVVEMIKSTGLKQTYNFVMNKLDAPSALGYSCAGEVIAIGEEVTNFKVGDFVACGGNSASHADVVCVPKNLAVKVPKKIPLKHACFTTLGAIALQGIRQADLKLGENCLIIGMGLIGQITAKILQASGIKVIGVDVSDEAVSQAKNNGILETFSRQQEGIEAYIQDFSGGFGMDGVIITAGTSSLDPIEFAGKTARKKGKIVIVGAVPTGFDRANFYKKELDLRMSYSYGPGRGDLNYEENGIDYPLAYVRWTENRNMQAFIELLAENKINLETFITHVFPLEKAEDAYHLIVNKKEHFNGVLIQYEEKSPNEKVILNQQNKVNSKANLALIGAGNFAQGTLLPNLKGLFSFDSILTNRGNIARYVGEKYGFKTLTNDEKDVFENEQLDTVFITTRHDSHAKYVIKAMEANKHIFVEKPLAISEVELNEVCEMYQKQTFTKHLIVGFNRRFSPAIQHVKKELIPTQAKSILIRINAGEVSADHWVNDPKIGGGRIIGEACHFIDLAQFIASSKIQTVSAEALSNANGIINSVAINLSFENGSIATILYLSNGNKNLNKEWIEVFSGGTIYQIDDFKQITIINNTTKTIKYKSQDKGHTNELKCFYESIVKGTESIIPFEESYQATLATFKVLESIREKRKIEI